MKRLHSKLVYFIAFFLSVQLFLISCDNKKDEEKEDAIDIDTIKSTVFNVGGELFSIPSPVETALLIQKSGVVFNKNILSDPKHSKDLSTDYLRALSLGVCGADLGYASLYNQSQEAIQYIGSIRQISEQLGLSSAFDKKVLEKLNANVSNKDSILLTISIAYQACDAYLKNNQRTDLSSLILVGGWLEGMHFSISGNKSKPNDAIKMRIGEQKQAITSIVKMLSKNNSADLKTLKSSLEELLKIYDGVQFSYHFVEPTTDTANKITYINSNTEITITADQIEMIALKIQEIRNNIVSVVSKS